MERTTNKSKGIELKLKMINGTTGCMNAEADWLFPKQTSRRVVRLKNTYCFQPMQGTPFFAGVSMPEQNKIQLVANREKASHYLSSGIEALNSSMSNVTVEISKWLFCNISTKGEKQQPASIKYYPTAADLYNYFTENGKANDEKSTSYEQLMNGRCKEEMLLAMLLSASIVTNFTRDNWDADRFGQVGNITDAYVITAAGFTYMMRFSGENASTAIDRDIFEEIRFTHPASFFQKETRDQLTFSVTTRHGKPKDAAVTSETEGQISIGSLVYMNDQEDTILAVVGMTVTPGFMEDILRESAENITADCSGSSAQRCYIIDENGYVVTSNRGTYKTGYFVGYFEGQLLEELLNKGIFEVRRYNDTQAECPQYKTDGSSSSSASPGNILRTFYYSVFHLLFGAVSRVLNVSLWVVSTLFTLLLNTFLLSGRGSAGVLAAKNVSCTKTLEIYLLTSRDFSSRNVLFDCSANCNQSYTIESLQGTNLAHVVVQDHCENGTLQCPIFSKDNEPKRTEDLSVCQQPRRDRRSLSQCYKLNGTYPQACTYVNENTQPVITIYIIVFVSVCVAIIIALVFNMYFRKYFHGRCC